MQIDGSMVDMATIGVGTITALIAPLRRCKCGKKPYFIRETAIVDMLNGVMLVPFVLMIGSVFSSKLMNELLTSAKITVAIGGLAGLFFVIGELFKDRP
jgi:hypothetical protein